MNAPSHLHRFAKYIQRISLYHFEWRENGKILEDGMGTTVLFRSELEQLFEQLQPSGLPTFVALVVLRSACAEAFDITKLQRNGVADIIPGTIPPAMQDEAAQICALLQKVRGLPRHLRSDQAIVRLMQVIFEGSEMYFQPDEAKAFASSFSSGNLDDYYTETLSEYFTPDFTTELRALILANARFAKLEDLQRALETGFQEVPQKADADIPENQKPEPEEISLLEQLLEDPETSGVASLAQQIVAALNIPMQAKGSSDLPLGGVSDITNRGNFDRLLLSELAQDDITLMARLANHEALFLRREEPPYKIERERIVLVDATIKTWGILRGFAISAALACGERNPIAYGLSAYSIGGDRFAHGDLRSKEGAFQLLGRLDPALHCGKGLQNCLEALPAGDKEVIFIAALSNLEDPAFVQQLIRLQTQLHYLILLDRLGKMQLYALHNGQRRLISEATFDLDLLLYRAPKPKQSRKREADPALPAFFHHMPAPLYMPAVSVRVRPHMSKVLSSNRIVVITESRRALYWQSGQIGATELFPYIPSSTKLDIQEFEERYLVISVIHSFDRYKSFFVYDFETDETQTQQIEKIEWAYGRYFEPGYIIYQRPGGPEGPTHTRRLSLIDGTDAPDVSPPQNRKNQLGRQVGSAYSLANIKPMLNAGYSVMTQPSLFSIREHGELALDDQVLVLDEAQRFFFRRKSSAVQKTTRHLKTYLSPPQYIGGNPNLPMRKAIWPDGTVFYSDKRGFLHIVSANPALAQISIVMLLDAPTAMWASDGAYAGNPYFYGPQTKGLISCADFQARYLQPILDQILSK